MGKKFYYSCIRAFGLLYSLLTQSLFAQGVATESLDTLTGVQKYYRAIHVMTSNLLQIYSYKNKNEHLKNEIVNKIG